MATEHLDLSKYKTLVFDCDGVILDSNKVKTDAFYQAALPYGEDNTRFLVEYHRLRGGISRFEKFRYFLQDHLGVADPAGTELEALLTSYASHVKDGLLTCACTPGLNELREQTPNTRWMVVSGGKQDELREVFRTRRIDQLFDGGIFGSPEPKDVIFKRELQGGNLCKPAIFFGDSKYDFQVASEFGLEFIFVSNWTEMTEWREFCNKEKIAEIASTASLTLIAQSDD